MGLFNDIHTIAVALTTIASRMAPPPEDVATLPPEEAVSYYDEARASLRHEVDEALATGAMSQEAADEIYAEIDKGSDE